MKEVAKMLKSLGPKYELMWRMDYFGPGPESRSMIMTLIFRDPDLKIICKHEHAVPFDHLDAMAEYGPNLLEDMSLAIQKKLREAWAEI